MHKCKTVQTHLHFVHHSCYDNNRPPTVAEWVLLPRNGNAMLRCVSVPVDNMVFCAHKYTRRTVESLGRCELTTWNLYKEVCPGVCGLAPFSYDVIEAQIEFIVG